MPRLRLTFEPLDRPEYSRRLYREEIGDPNTFQLIFKSFKDDTAVISVPDERGIKFTTQVLDSKGNLIIGSDRTHNFFPDTQPSVPDGSGGNPVGITEPDISQGEGPFVGVKLNLVSHTDTSATTSNNDVPVPEAADDTPEGGVVAAPDTVATSGNVEVKTSPEKNTQVEIRVSASTVTDPSDAMHATQVSVDAEDIKVPLCTETDKQRVWVRRFDPDGCRSSDWVFRDMTVVNDDTFNRVEDFSNNWIAGGTIDSTYGYPNMSVNLGTLHVNEVPSMFALDAADGAPLEGFPNSVFSMDQGPGMFSMDAVFPYGRFETAAVDAGAVHDFYPAFCPMADSLNRIAERSIFSEDYYMFSQFHGPNSGVPSGLRKPVGSTRDISMFGTQSDGSPIRVLNEVSVDSGAWRVWKPGQRISGRIVKARFTTFAHRGLRAPSWLFWFFRRWIRNRKWEWNIPFTPDVPGNGSTMTILLPMHATSVIGLTVQAQVETVAVNGIEYNISVDTTSTPGSAIVNVEQTYRSTVEGVAGAWQVDFPKFFGTVPTVVATANNPADFSYAGYTAITTQGATGYISAPVSSQSSGPVDIIARGSPLDAAINIAIQIMGA